MTEILKATETSGDEFRPAYPFYIFIEGDISGKTVAVQYRRANDDTATWYAQKTIDTFDTDDDRLIQFNGYSGDFIWRVMVTAGGAGVSAHWGEIRTDQV